MDYIRLGKTELMVSRLGFGGIPITRVSFEQAQRCIHTAIDLGVNFIDTGQSYGDSEEKIGRAIKGRRDGLVIATKSAPTTAQGMAENIDQSLRRLQLDTIDLYQFHLVRDEDTLRKSLDLMTVMEKARKQGKIRHVGVSVHGMDWIKRILETDAFETIMITLNFIVREPAEIALPRARQRDTGIIAMKLMAGGHIEDAYLAFKFFLQFDDIVGLIGIQSPQEIREIVSIMEENVPATAEELSKMARIRAESGDRFCRLWILYAV